MKMYSYAPGITLIGEDRVLVVREEFPPRPVLVNDVQYGTDIFTSWIPEQLSTIGIKEFIEDNIPEHYSGGVPVDVETATQVHRTYPNSILNVDAWVSELKLASHAKKVAKRDGGFLVDGVLFDSDNGANVAYLNFYTRVAADPSYTTMWKASGNTWVEMNAELFAKVSAAFQANMEAAFTWQAGVDQMLANSDNSYDSLKAIEDYIKEVN